VYLCERIACKHKLSDLGIDMIHKLGIHGPNEGNVIHENIANSATAVQIQKLADSIRHHVSMVANGKQLSRVILAFRVRLFPST
jgi:hypothetical protein